MPLLETKGAGSAQGFGEFTASGPKNYIEDVFSTWLYDGTGATQTITNNIDLSTKGGLVWIKRRTSAASHKLTDTVRGATKALSSNDTNAQTTDTTGLTAFSTTGFTLGSDANYNASSTTNVAWTFREQPKFFDIVTYTGTGANTTIAHSLGSVPGSMIVRRDTSANWPVYHRSLANTDYLYLNSTAASATDATLWNSTTPTSSVFSVGTSASVNASGGTYIAYLFAHNAGGFGLTGLDNVISCSLFTTDATGKVTVNLGYEPQFILYKQSDAVGDWRILDTMRGLTTNTDQYLRPNLTSAEAAASLFEVNSTGFYWAGGNTNANYIYIAIRRGPMKVPTDATKVFLPSVSNTANVTFTTGFTVDMFFSTIRAGWARQAAFIDRLRGATATLESSNTDAESTAISSSKLDLSNSYTNGGITAPLVSEAFARAPSFMDVVCFSGTGSTQTITHNLGVAPELFIIKCRNNLSSAQGWPVYAASQAATKAASLNTTGIFSGQTIWANTAPTASVFTVGGGDFPSGDTYVAYLFATCAGVSKVGSYSGTGATQTISCGFTGGARFVLIKRADSTGDWWTWNTAQGMVAASDYRFGLNTTTGETNANWVYTATGGFQIVTTDASVNASGGTYIFLAIA